ncbi:MAG: GNAT family acetyltransferase [Calditrichaeota bacterium]|nr:MAG: GNAT family acetyltransferase [Calditrichota bacterium]
MNFKQLQMTREKFGNGAVVHILKYSFLNKISFYKELQGLTVTMETLNKDYLQLDDAFQARFLSNDELYALSENPDTYISRSFLERNLPKGDMCYAIMQGDVLASYGWYSDKPTLITPELELHFDPQWIYMYKGYTMPAFRGKRLHAIGMARSLQAYTEKGYKGIISYVETSNFPSLRSCDRMGYKNFGKVRIFKGLSGYSITTEPACQQYGFTVKVKTHDPQGKTG